MEVMFNSNIFYNFLFANPPDNRASKMSKKFRLDVFLQVLDVQGRYLTMPRVGLQCDCVFSWSNSLLKIM